MAAGDSFDFDSLDAFVPGAVGEPGGRVFYLQARLGKRIVSLRCEKQQVGMLGRYLTQLAEAIGPVEVERDVVGLVEPVEEQWTVGQLSVGVDEANGRILVTAEELVAQEILLDDVELDDPDMDDPDIDDDPDLLDAALLSSLVEAAGEMLDEPAEARFVISAGQALAFGERAEELLSAGRPACRLCGAPIDPEGHACPRWN
ncbi:MAG: DUF3090 family protein [Microthrixaceae bacterium]